MFQKDINGFQGLMNFRKTFAKFIKCSAIKSVLKFRKYSRIWKKCSWVLLKIRILKQEYAKISMILETDFQYKENRNFKIFFNLKIFTKLLKILEFYKRFCSLRVMSLWNVS